MKKRLPELKEKIRSNGLYKLVALFVSIVIWSTTINGRKESVLVRDMNLEFITQPNFTVSTVNGRSVRIKVEGSRLLLKRFSQMSSVLPVNLIELTDGEHEINLTGRRVELPVGLKIINATPDKVKVSIKAIKAKEGA
jgi:hypothetical protein